MNKYLKLLGSFIGGAAVTGGATYTKTNDVTLSVILGVLAGVSTSTGHAMTSPFDIETNRFVKKGSSNSGTSESSKN